MESTQSNKFRGWEYANKGDYHRNLDLNWSYAPTYLKKISFIREYITKNCSQGDNIIDLGCGEGVLVDEFKQHNYNITGLDLNYESANVIRGSILNMPFKDNSYNLALLLDVFEHIHYADQPTLLKEIKRILPPNGTLIAAIPNLAHIQSRVELLTRGILVRTDVPTNHVGERTFRDNIEQLERHDFKIKQITSTTLTLPWVYRKLIAKKPAKYRWLHDALDYLQLHSFSMLNIFVLQNIK